MNADPIELKPGRPCCLLWPAQPRRRRRRSARPPTCTFCSCSVRYWTFSLQSSSSSLWPRGLRSSLLSSAPRRSSSSRASCEPGTGGSGGNSREHSPASHSAHVWAAIGYTRRAVRRAGAQERAAALALVAQGCKQQSGTRLGALGPPALVRVASALRCRRRRMTTAELSAADVAAPLHALGHSAALTSSNTCSLPPCCSCAAARRVTPCPAPAPHPPSAQAASTLAEPRASGKGTAALPHTATLGCGRALPGPRPLLSAGLQALHLAHLHSPMWLQLCYDRLWLEGCCRSLLATSHGEHSGIWWGGATLKISLPEDIPEQISRWLAARRPAVAALELCPSADSKRGTQPCHPSCRPAP